MEAIMKLEDFHIHKRIEKHKRQIRRRTLSALLILKIGGITLWLI